MMGEELKPCPFCGHDASVFGVCGVVKVLCSNCGASTGPRLSLQGAIEDWNRRAIDVDALREVVAEIEDADVDGTGDWADRIRKAASIARTTAT